MRASRGAAAKSPYQYPWLISFIALQKKEEVTNINLSLFQATVILTLSVTESSQTIRMFCSIPKNVKNLYKTQNWS
jgi:hypothetical protein